MTDKERLLAYDDVNKCETIEELQDCIVSLADEKGMIQGRTRKFDAFEMANNLEIYVNGRNETPNVLTREFGIRQQAMYIKHYYYD